MSQQQNYGPSSPLSPDSAPGNYNGHYESNYYENHRFSSSTTASSDFYLQQQHPRPDSAASSHATLTHGPLQLTPHGFDDNGPPVAALSPHSQALLDQAEAALRNLSDLAASNHDSWKPVLTHGTGAVVYRTAKGSKQYSVPVFKGVNIVHGFAPDAIFPLIKNRQLWDNWYLDGHVVDHINDTTSLSYMVMKPGTALSQAIASTRDLALVDRKAFYPATGTIAYASTSVDTPKIPKHPGRVRALLMLNGWVLEPQIATDGRTLGTKVSYYIQTDVGGMLPGSVVKRYLARRALVVVGVEDYLRKNGPPPQQEADAQMLRRATVHTTSPTTTRSSVYSEQEQIPQFPPFVVAPERSTSMAQRNPAPVAAVVPSAFVDPFMDSSNFRRNVLPVIDQHQHQQQHQRPVAATYNSHEMQRNTAIAKEQQQQHPQTQQQQQHPASAGGAEDRHAAEHSATDSESLSDLVAVDEMTEDEREDDDDRDKGIYHQSSIHETTSSSVLDMPAPKLLAEEPAAPEPVSTNPHNEAGNLSLRLLQGLEPKEAGWTPHSENQGVQIFLKTIAGAPMPMVRGDAVLKAPHTAQQVLSVVKSASARKLWDGRFEDGRALVNYNLDEALMYSQQKGTFPVSGRDFVTTNLTHFDPDGTIYYTATSVVDRASPTDSKRVRAHLTVAGWIIKPLPQGGVAVTYIVQVDIKGNVPSSIIKVIQTQTPLCIAEIFKYIADKSFIPFVVRAGSQNPGRHLSLRTEDYSQKDSTYTLEYRKTTHRGRVVLIALPANKAYKNGAQLAVSPKDKVEVYKVHEWEDDVKASVGTDAVLLKVVVAGDAAGDVDVIITVKPGREWTVNGGPLLPEPPKEMEQPRVVENVKREIPSTPTVIPPTPPTAQPVVAPAAEPVTVATPVVASEIPGAKSVTAARPASPVPKPAAPAQVAVARPTYIPHRHTESGVKALKYLKQLVTDDNPTSNWKYHSDQHGVKISTIEETAGGMPIVRGDAVFPPEYSVDDVVNVLRSNGARKIWDARFEEGTMVEYLNPNEFVFHSRQKGQFPVSGRDICGLQVTIFDARSQTTYVVATSVLDNQLVPPTSKYVRADLTVAGWVLKPAPQGGVAVTYVVKIDVKGNIPSAIVKAVSIQTPLCVAEVLKYLRANGAPPAAKVLGNNTEGVKTTVKKDLFDHKSGTYELSYVLDATSAAADTITPVAKTAGLVELAVDARMYLAGIDLEIPHATADKYLRVRVTPDKRFVRIYIDGEAVKRAGIVAVDVRMLKRKGRADQLAFTVNGVQGSVETDESNAIMVAVKKSATTSANNGSPVPAAPGATAAAPIAASAVAGNSRSSQPAASRAVPESATASAATTLVAASASQPVKRRAQSISASSHAAVVPASVLTPTTTISSASSSSSSSSSTSTRYTLALLSLVLRLLRPFLAPHAPATLPDSADPLDLRAVVKDSDPKRLVAVAAIVVLIVGLVVRWALKTIVRTVGGIFGMLSTPQWVLVAALGLVAIAYGRERGEKKREREALEASL
ncbi:hypothetical protein PhCBS80983_g02412 [Powellomyces hirtus]|uniref:START domain-containing protein n=1 Tax=Powellomyces hirtus TaxID=109895 RepID=A0A507E8Z7_9FUNG|nr:hypothetical protein PhCBS80983_g02412 [Powellomyces hirtus]